MSCSAISKCLADLEVRIGCKLCHRGRSGFCVTPEGEKYYEAAQELTASLREFKSTLWGIRQNDLIQIRVGVVDATLSDPNNPLPKLIKQNFQCNDKIDVKIQVDSSVAIADKILSEQLDFGLTYQQGVRAPLTAIELYRENLLFILRKHHPLQDKLVQFQQNAVSMEMLITWIKNYGLASFKTKFELAKLIDNDYFPEPEHYLNTEEVLWRVSMSDRFGIVPGHILTKSAPASHFLKVNLAEAVYSPMYLLCRQEKRKQPLFQQILSGNVI